MPFNQVLRWEFIRISELNPTICSTRKSNPTDIGGLEWRVHVTAENSARTGNVSYLGIYISCQNPRRGRFWQCQTRVVFKLINRNDAALSTTSQVSLTFYPDCNPAGTGNQKLEVLSKIMDASQGFILEDKIIVEAHVTIMKTYGVGVTSIIKDFAEPDDTTDVCLIVENKKVHVSKAVLAAHSAAFKTMFFGKLEESQKAEIALLDVNHKDFVELLNVMYSSIHEFTDESVERILALADRFIVKLVLEAAEVYLMYHTQLNLAKKLLLADTYKLNDAMAYLIYSIKKTADIKLIEKEDAFMEYSDGLKAKMMDRTLELMKQ